METKEPSQKILGSYVFHEPLEGWNSIYTSTALVITLY